VTVTQASSRGYLATARRGHAAAVLGASSLLFLILLSLVTGFAETGDPPLFTDRRIAAGITFKHHANQTGDKFLIEMMGGGVAVLDYNSDDWLDLFFVNSGGLALQPDAAGDSALGASRSRKLPGRKGPSKPPIRMSKA